MSEMNWLVVYPEIALLAMACAAAGVPVVAPPTA